MAIEGDFRRFCFDRAVTTFGLALEQAVDGVQGKGKTLAVKRQRVIDRWLDRELRYRSPVATASSTSKDDSIEPGAQDEVVYVMRGDGSEIGSG